MTPTPPTRRQRDEMTRVQSEAKAANIDPPAEFLGYMYLAKRPCGRVSASSWDDAQHAKAVAKDVGAWIRRGLVIERIARYRGDPQPDWICDGCRGKSCNPPAPSAGTCITPSPQGETDV